MRLDLAHYVREHPGVLEELPLGAMGVTTTADDDIEPGIIFCLRGETTAANERIEAQYPLAPYYLMHVREGGAVVLSYVQARLVLDRLKRLCLGRDLADEAAVSRFDRETRNGEDMQRAQDLFAAAVASIAGKEEERAVASLFSAGGTHAMRGEFAGMEDFEVVAWLVVLPADSP
jgi:hypothetical protein